MAERPLGQVYEKTRSRVVALVRDAPDGADTPVPACAEWTVRDAIAHVTGIYGDIVSGNLQGAGGDAWTRAQVDARRHLTVDELLAESDRVGPQLAAMIDDFPGRYGNQLVADLAVHEQDIRGALGRPGARRSAAIGVATEFVLGAIVGPGAAAVGGGPLEIGAGDRSWVVGTGEPGTGDPDAAIAAAIAMPPPDPNGSTNGRDPVGCVTASGFDLFRALTGRRSAAQVRAFQWTTDPEPYLAYFSLWPFTLRATDLVE